jgi:hypothetical protein
MATFPPEPTDPNDLINQLTGSTPTSGDFLASTSPSVSGFGTRQSRLKNERIGVSTRHMMHWLIPEGPIVEMYVNPESMSVTEGKVINEVRTKGGYTLQYWGEDLGKIRLSGTTGTSGKEGLNILRDVYRNEQLAMDPYALFLASQRDAENSGLTGQVGAGVSGFLSNAIGGVGGAVVGAVGGELAGLALGNSSSTAFSRPRPTLAYLATTIELYFRGEVFRGYFKSFTATETAQELGLFHYDIDFTYTQRRGFGQNFLPWHRSATSGPSNSDPVYGTPHSFKYLGSGVASTPQREPASSTDTSNSISSSIQSFLNNF